MSRIARIVLPGLPHHVTQRGNNREDVFLSDDDRRHYLRLLRQQATKHGLKVLGYCLMANHVHVIAIPASSGTLGRAVGRTHFIYTRLFNEAHGRSGHLWQGRFYSCALDGARLLMAMRHIEQNPVRARLAKAACEYPWSSADAHAGGLDASGLLDLTTWKRLSAGVNWEAFLREQTAEEDAAEMKRYTQTGRPWCGKRLLDRFEHEFDRQLHARPVGRPRKHE